MQTRHRIPTIFNLSMVDVLCCALGCVILLWLINFREARQRAALAGQTAAQLAETVYRLDQLQRERQQLAQGLMDFQKQYRQLSEQLAGLRQQHLGLEQKQRTTAAALARLQEQQRQEQREYAAARAAWQQTRQQLEQALASQKTATAQQEQQLARMTKELAQRQTLIRQLQQAQAHWQQEAQKRQEQLDLAESHLRDLSEALAGQSKALTDTDQRLRQLLAEKTALQDMLSRTQRQVQQHLTQAKEEKGRLEQQLLRQENALAELRGQLARATTQNQDLQKSLEQLRRALDQAESEREQARRQADAARQEARRVQAAVENRFAGLELLGRKVVFLIDTSGSMKMRDENTLSPEKWPAVCATVGRLLRSLPDLTHYQVLLFSDQVRYLHGHAGEWLVFDPGRSPEETVAALRRLDPQGGTKMAPAFAEAFRFRTLGLDTLYLFSDGLPNDDDQLPDEVANLPEAQRTVWLCQQIRQRLRNEWNRPLPGLPPVRIQTIGFYFDSPEVGAFLWALAREHQGGFVGMSRP
jgi:septal ring factor EnvC (AmiA/AmiB activator)